MSLTLHMHPLSSFCHKVLIALYENATPCASHLVDLRDADAREQLRKLWPLGKFPVLRDAGRGRTVPESSVIIEYLARHYPGPVQLIPENPELAAEVRALDRFYDLHIHEHMQKVIGDRLRPDGRHDPFGVDQARARMRAALAVAEPQMRNRTWAAGEQFTMADCAAAPALFYADRIVSLAGEFPYVNAYRDRLMNRPSYRRVLKEAEPYLAMIPG